MCNEPRWLRRAAMMSIAAVKVHTAAGAGDKSPLGVVPLFQIPALEKPKKEVMQHIR